MHINIVTELSKKIQTLIPHGENFDSRLSSDEKYTHNTPNTTHTTHKNKKLINWLILVGIMIMIMIMIYKKHKFI